MATSGDFNLAIDIEAIYCKSSTVERAEQIREGYPDEQKTARKLPRMRRRVEARAQDYAWLASGLDALPWPSRRARATDQSVLTALLKVCKDSGEKVTHGAAVFVAERTVSYRYLSEIAAIGSSDTLRRSLKRLQTMNVDGGHVLVWTAPSTDDGGSHSFAECSRFRIRVPVRSRAEWGIPDALLSRREGDGRSATRNPHSDGASTGDLPTLEARLHILWSNQGVRDTARRVWQELCAADGSRIATLSSKLDVDRKTVRKHLVWLRSVGLARDERGIWRGVSVPVSELDAIAEGESVDLLDWRNRKAQAHERDREGFARFCEGAERRWLLSAEAKAKARHCPAGVDPLSGEVLDRDAPGPFDPETGEVQTDPAPVGRQPSPHFAHADDTITDLDEFRRRRRPAALVSAELVATGGP